MAASKFRAVCVAAKIGSAQAAIAHRVGGECHAGAATHTLHPPHSPADYDGGIETTWPTWQPVVPPSIRPPSPYEPGA